MMRALTLIGLLAVYILAAFEPPSADFASQLKSRAKLAAAMTAAPLAAWDVQTALDLESAAKILEEIAKQVPALGTKKVLPAVGRDIQAMIVAWGGEGAARDYLAGVERAYAKSSVHACERIGHGDTDAPDAPPPSVFRSPSRGEYLAYCLALVTKDGSRCAQIDGGTAPPLKEICERQLPTTAHFLSFLSQWFLL